MCTAELTLADLWKFVAAAYLPLELRHFAGSDQLVCQSTAELQTLVPYYKPEWYNMELLAPLKRQMDGHSKGEATFPAAAHLKEALCCLHISSC